MLRLQNKICHLHLPIWHVVRTVLNTTEDVLYLWREDMAILQPVAISGHRGRAYTQGTDLVCS